MAPHNSPLNFWQGLASSTHNRAGRYSQQFHRQRRFLLLMGAGTVVASACSNVASTQERSTGSPSTATRLIQHAYGETEVPANPTRIVALGYFEVEALMSLGFQPIAAPAILVDNLLHLPPAENEIVDIGSPSEPSLEQIATLNPDLILATKMFTKEDVYPLLSQIAPTVVLDADGQDDWQKLTQLCAEALGKETEAAQLKVDYEAKLQTLQAQLAQDPSQTQVSVVSFGTGQIITFGNETYIGTVLEAAGLARPPKQAEGGMTQISRELLSDIDGDFLFVMKPQSQTELAAEVREALEQMKEDPLWGQLKAVQNDRVYEVDTYWFGVGYMAANLVLDDLMKHIA
ncbi:MAG: iron-siderophore ABC transporter substrate-binding protein [Cyanobacteria bacterium P01_H01_bin.58]